VHDTNELVYTLGSDTNSLDTLRILVCEAVVSSQLLLRYIHYPAHTPHTPLTSAPPEPTTLLHSRCYLSTRSHWFPLPPKLPTFPYLPVGYTSHAQTPALSSNCATGATTVCSNEPLLRCAVFSFSWTVSLSAVYSPRHSVISRSER
jgi:hypothetical protein